MGKVKDITGKRFSKLLAIRFVKIEKTHAIWLFKCDCGKEKEIIAARVGDHESGKAQSCGCILAERMAEIKPGTIYNDLSVIKLSRIDKQKARVYLCKCSCGKETEARGGALTGGFKKSCGCKVGTRGLKDGESAINSTVHTYKKNAATRGLCWQLTHQEAHSLFIKPCHYCGIASSNLQKIKGGRGEFHYNGIDRVNNNIGYVKDNCVPCCKTCNYCKSRLDPDIWEEWLDRVAKFRINQKENKQCPQ